MVCCTELCDYRRRTVWRLGMFPDISTQIFFSRTACWFMNFRAGFRAMSNHNRSALPNKMLSTAFSFRPIYTVCWNLRGIASSIHLLTYALFRRRIRQYSSLHLVPLLDLIDIFESWLMTVDVTLLAFLVSSCLDLTLWERPFSWLFLIHVSIHFFFTMSTFTLQALNI